MRLSNVFFLFMLCGLFTQFAFANNSEQDLGKTFNDSENVLRYWTPERLKNAKPKLLPTVNEKTLRIVPNEIISKQKSITTQAAPPTIDIKPNLTSLFDVSKQLPKMTPIPNDRGTYKLDFSSSQLVPVSADLSYPYRTVGKLFFSDDLGYQYSCSASVIANRVVVTAGHCVHAGTAEGYYRNFIFIPAYRDGKAPYQAWTASYALTTKAWMTSDCLVPNAGDFAVLQMNDNVNVEGKTISLGNVTGKLGTATNKLTPNHLHHLGYPCNFDQCEQMHQVTAGSGPAIAPNNVEYGSDARSGSSGGPWIQNFGIASVGQEGGLNFGMNQVVAVTSWGDSSLDPKIQGASNFDDTFTEILNKVCARQAGNC